MSLVYITHHNENIFDIEKQWKQENPYHSNYVSKYRKSKRSNAPLLDVQTLEDGKKLLTDSKKSQHKTMGYAETPLDPPCAFLRKQQGIKWRRLNVHVCPKGPGMPPVPRFEPSAGKITTIKRKEPFIDVHCPHPRYFKNHQHRANFIAVNIELIKKAKTHRPPPRYVDTPKGDRHNLINTGLVPQYICSKTFGKVPCYLLAQKKMIKEIQARCELEKRQEGDECLRYVSGGLRQLTIEERQEILAGLKKNFADINKTYLGLSLYSDTIAKMLRKGKLENELRQLEQDIFLIESNPTIYISNY